MEQTYCFQFVLYYHSLGKSTSKKLEKGILLLPSDTIKMLSTQESFNFVKSILSETLKKQQKFYEKVLFENEFKKWYKEEK